MSTMDYKELLNFCTTPRERELLELLASGLSQREAAEKMGMHKRSAEKKVQTVRTKAAKLAPLHNATLHDQYNIPSPFTISRTTTLYGDEGQVRLRWVQAKPDEDEKLRLLVEAVSTAIEAYEPLPRVKEARQYERDLLAILPMGDPHIGMYAWAGETGEDFDCSIAEANMRQAVQRLVDSTPPCETCIILNLGDFFHADNTDNRTARSGHSLDVDTRWARVLMIGVTLMIDCVNMALAKHGKVIVKNNIGNHDDHTSQALSVCMMHAFKDNPRVEIANPADPFFMYEFGRNLVVSTHGHMVKPAQMHGVVANYWPQEWGRTEHRYCYLGHFHHEKRVEEHGLITEIFNTLASSDAWHHASGYRAKRNMKALVLHKDDGEIQRFTFNIRRLSNGR